MTVAKAHSAYLEPQQCVARLCWTRRMSQMTSQ